MMKRKVAFWVVMVLVNAGLGVISVRTYQSLEARITGVESYNRSLDAKQYMSYQDLRQLQSAHQKTTAELLRILGIDGKYDFNNNLTKVRDLKKFLDYKVYVKASATLESPEALKELSSDLAKIVIVVEEAPAVVIGRYVLMDSHTNDVDFLSRKTLKVATPGGIIAINVNLKVLEYSATLYTADGSERSLKELYRNREKDFSLFEIPASLAGGPKDVKALNFPFEIGKSDELRIGHFIYMNGRPGIHSEVARPGAVTSLVRATEEDELGVKKNKDEFGLSQSTDLGDSGSPVMAFRDGRPELVGIYLGWVGFSGDNGKNTRSRALKINVAVDEIKVKLGIDLRELQRRILNK